LPTPSIKTLAKNLRRAIYLSVGLLALLLVAVGIWFGKVWYESQVGGPRATYLLLNAPDSIRIRWGTAQKITGSVYYGTDPAGLDRVVSEPDAVRDHRVTLNGLQAGTRYFYRIKNQDQWQQAEPQWFYTSPAPTQSVPARVWVLGDPGYASPIQTRVRDQALHWLMNHPRVQRPYVDMLLTTGDNAYTSGKNREFDRNFFVPFQTILQNIPLWAVFGNHDARRWAFYDIFDSPLKGESGGLPSGDRGYFSFDYAQTHFVILDSHHGDMSPGSTMLRWLQQDLKQNTRQWTIVLFHEPPYTRSTHNSDAVRDSRGRLFRARENVLPILEQAGVDLVFSGHSHSYERSYMLACHYGTSETLAPWMQQSSSMQSPKLVPLYMKPDIHAASYSGTIYTVLGSSAKVDNGPLNHPAMAVSLRQAGSVILDINTQRLSMLFINAEGEIADQFSIIKDKALKPARFDSCSARQAYYKTR